MRLLHAIFPKTILEYHTRFSQNELVGMLKEHIEPKQNLRTRLFVDVYDLLWFSIIQKASLADLGLNAERVLTQGELLIGTQTQATQPTTSTLSTSLKFSFKIWIEWDNCLGT